MLRSLFKTKITSSSDFLKELLSNKFDDELLEEALKNKKVDINFVDEDGNTFLHTCIANGKFKAAHWLMKHNINIAIRNKEDKTPLDIAVKKGNKPLVREILEKDVININEKDENGRILLQDLVVNGDNDMAKLLIEYGADINSTDKQHKNVIFDALAYGDENFILYLLSIEEPEKIELNNQDRDLNTVMHHKEILTNDKLAQLFIEHGADPTIKNAKGESFLCKTALKGKKAAKLIDVALAHGADINMRSGNDNTIFMEIMNAFAKLSPDEKERRQNLLDISKHIILKGADINSINKDKETTLFHAVRVHDIELIAFLLGSGIDPNIKNKYGQTAFLETIYRGIKYLDVLILMIEYGADPLVTDHQDHTVFELLNNIILHTHGKKELKDEFVLKKLVPNAQYMVVLKELLEQTDAPLDILDSNGNPMFFEPLLCDDYQVFRLYIKNGANVHQVNHANENIFFAYVYRVFEDDRLDIDFQSNLSRLLGYKVNHNYQDGIGWTVVHKILSTNCNEKLFDILTKVVRFDYTIVDKLGRSVIHTAIWNNKPNIIRKIHLIDAPVIDIADVYNMLPITYAALLGSQDLVILFIKMNGSLSSGKPVPPQAVKKFSPMLKNLPKLQVGIEDDESLLLRIKSLTDQIKRAFDVD